MNAPAVYAVLSLIPSAAISFVSWLLKTKVYQFDFAKHLKTTQTTEDSDEQRDANDLDTSSEEEHIPLLKVDENCDSESSFNHNKGHHYGAAKDDKKNHETSSITQPSCTS